MQRVEEYQNERLDHLGIVAEVCQEMGLAQWLDALAPCNRAMLHELGERHKERASPFPCFV